MAISQDEEADNNDGNGADRPQSSPIKTTVRTESSTRTIDPILNVHSTILPSERAVELFKKLKNIHR